MDKYKILTAGTASELARQVEEKRKEGFIPVGSHQVVEIHKQNRFAGTQHMDTIIKVEYSQTVVFDSEHWVAPNVDIMT